MKFPLLTLLGAMLLSACLPYLTKPGDTRTVVTHAEGQERRYLLYVPPSHLEDEPAPLVITFHGFVQWPAHQLWMSRWNELADEEGFLVAYPSGSQLPKRWTVGGPSGILWAPEPDIAFVLRMIAEIARDYHIDLDRIYVNGMSNGGGMSFVLACELAEWVAAAGIVAGGIVEPPTGCKPARPVPLIAFHGTDDGIVPWDGSEWFGPIRLQGFPQWTGAWAERNGCAPTPVTAPVTTHVHRKAYGDCRDDADVHLYVVEGGGHTWPGGEALPRFIAGHTTDEIDATRTMWNFFQAHSRHTSP